MVVVSSISASEVFSFDKDIEDLAESFPNLLESYIPVERIGEGTFSVVYKAIDVLHFQTNNSSWIHASRQDEDDLVLYDRSVVSKLSSKTKLQSIFKKFILNAKQKPHFVALKKINTTSNPDRIRDELYFLKQLDSAPNIIPLITALRHEDQIIAVYPYFKHEDFREYFSKMTLLDIKYYMWSLLVAVKSVHDHRIIHRDLKPNNFLYSFEERRGFLVDFGLAQREPETCSKAEQKIMCMRSKVTIPLTKDGSSLLYTPNALNCLKKLPPGYYVTDNRHPMKANRAGTRGFRAPEVLFKHTDQNRSIDIWSVGVIFLCILTRRYPFFNSLDDLDAIIEISCVVGVKIMEKIACMCGRNWNYNLPNTPLHHVGFEKLVSKFNPELSTEIDISAYDLLYKMMNPNWYERITADEALKHSFFSDLCK